MLRPPCKKNPSVRPIAGSRTQCYACPDKKSEPVTYYYRTGASSPDGYFCTKHAENYGANGYANTTFEKLDLEISIPANSWFDNLPDKVEL